MPKRISGLPCTSKIARPAGFFVYVPKVLAAGVFFVRALHHNKNVIYLSSHATRSYYEILFEENMFLVFGKESQGLPKEIIERNHSSSFKIPMYSEKIRSLNLANAVSIVVYEGLRNFE